MTAASYLPPLSQQSCGWMMKSTILLASAGSRVTAMFDGTKVDTLATPGLSAKEDTVKPGMVDYGGHWLGDSCFFGHQWHWSPSHSGIGHHLLYLWRWRDLDDDKDCLRGLHCPLSSRALLPDPRARVWATFNYGWGCSGPPLS